MKIGIDIHGTADKFPEFFAELSRLFVEAGHEVHIITGQRQKTAEPLLKKIGVVWTHFHSIIDYQESLGTKINGTFENPKIDPILWDQEKGRYAKKMGIDMHFDDSDEYCRYFRTPYARIQDRAQNPTKTGEMDNDA